VYRQAKKIWYCSYPFENLIIFPAFDSDQDLVSGGLSLKWAV
jgi:hypothetical protein